MAAWALDRVIVAAPLTALTAAGSALDVQRYSSGVAVLTATVMVVNWVYWVYCWSQVGSSLGQLPAGLRVDSTAEDRALTLTEASLRWAVLEAPFGLLLVIAPGPLWYAAAVVVAVWNLALLATVMDDPWRRGLHDRLARSLVVRDTGV